MSNKRTTGWYEFTLHNPDRPKRAQDTRKVSRKTPSVLFDAVATQDHTERWKLLEKYRISNPGRCA